MNSAFSWKRVTICVSIIIFSLVLIYKYAGDYWRPILIKSQGGKTVDDRMVEIRTKYPELDRIVIHNLTLIGIKDPGYLDVVINGKVWQRMKFTANSGAIGPKIQEGDGQIPEGIYGIDAVNPNSLYHLSLRVSYPNNDDKIRAKNKGITHLGGDIYIHGSNGSIGCVAIGDRSIEKVFFLVNKIGFNKAKVILSPKPLEAIPKVYWPLNCLQPIGYIRPS